MKAGDAAKAAATNNAVMQEGPVAEAAAAYEAAKASAAEGDATTAEVEAAATALDLTTGEVRTGLAGGGNHGEATKTAANRKGAKQTSNVCASVGPCTGDKHIRPAAKAT